MSEYTSPTASNEERHAATENSVARSVQDRAGEGARVVAGNAAEVAGTVREQAAQVAGEASAQARDLLTEARAQVQDQARAQTGRLAENVRRLAHELRDMADHGKPDSTATAAVAQIADGGHRVADHLDRRGPDGLLEDVQDFARRRPGLFLAGAALAGFALGRTGKGVAAAGSSSPAPVSAPTPASEHDPLAGREYPPQAPVSPPAPPRSPVAAPLTGPGIAPDPYEAYGRSQPPHTTPAYGSGPGYGRQQPPAQGV